MDTARRSRLLTAIAAATAIALAGVLMPASAIAASPPRPGVPKPAAGPTVTSISPTSGPLGATVTITGTGFTAPATVNFTGTSGTNAASTGKVVSATKLTTTVNSTASTGPVTVTTAGSTVSAGTFTVTTSIRASTSTGVPGSTTAIYGAGFTPNELVDLYAGTTDQALISATSRGNFTATGFTIPASAQPGAFTITAAGRKSGTSAQTTFTVNTDWAQTSYGTAHTGLNPYENTISTANVGKLGQKWSAPVATQNSGPTVVGGVVYAGGADGNVSALNAATGATIWKYATGGSVYSTPAVVGGVVYVGATDGNIYALNAPTGTLKWEYNTGAGIYGSPAVSGGVVYVGATDGNLYSVNASTGAFNWYVTTGDAISYSSPAVSGGTVYVGSQDGYLYAFDATTGAAKWTYLTGNVVLSNPVVANGLVYFGSNDDVFSAVNTTTGALRWSAQMGSVKGVACGRGSAAVSGPLVYAQATNGSLVAYNAKTGAISWKDATASVGCGAPTVANGVVYDGGTDGSITAYDAASGAMLAFTSLPTRIDGALPIVNGVVYASSATTGSTNGQTVALDLPSGLTSGNAHPKPSSLHPNRALTAVPSRD